MGWKTQDAYGQTDKRGFKRLPWRNRFIFQRVGWALSLVFVVVTLIIALNFSLRF